MHSKQFMLFVGRSGSGKTTIVEELKKKYGLKDIESYTTRKPRFEGEPGHTFVSVEDIPNKEEMVGYTEYNGNFYWATQKDVEASDMYVIDTSGIEFFRKHYKGEKPYIIFQIYAPPEECKRRMITRGDSEKAAQERIEYDKKAFAHIDSDVIIHNGENNLEEAIREVLKYINLEND